MTDQGAITDGITYRAQWLPGFGINRDYTLCPNDATHVIHASGSYDLPVGRGRAFLSSANPVTQSVLGGWGVNYIVSYQSGQPFTIACPDTDHLLFRLQCDQDSWRERVCRSAHPEAMAKSKCVRKCAGGYAAGPDGLLPAWWSIRNRFRGPQLYQCLTRLSSRSFPIREAVHLQFSRGGVQLVQPCAIWQPYH